MKVQELEARLAEVESKIGKPHAFLIDSPGSSRALTDRQKYTKQIETLEWKLRNNAEVMINNFTRLIAEERGKLDEMKQFSAKAERKLEEMKFSPGRLQLAVNGDDLWRMDETVEGLLWWIETAKEKIRSQEREVARFENLRKGKQNDADRARDEISLLKSELASFDDRNRAALEAERAALTGWPDARGDDRDEDGDDAEAQPQTKRPRGRAVRELEAEPATPAPVAAIQAV